MATNPRPEPQVYQDFQPPTEWAHEPKWVTLIVHLPDFRPERLRVQVTSNGKLRISGEAHLGENKWRRFLSEFPISSSCDTTRITAKYEGGVLYVRQPKMIGPVDPKEKSIKPQEEAEPQIAPPPKPDQKPNINEQQKKNDQQSSKPPNVPLPEESANKETDQSGAKSSGTENDDKKSGKETREENTESNKERHEIAEEKLGDGNRDSDEKGIRRAGSYRKVASDLVKEMKKQRNLVNMAIVVLLILILFLYPTKPTNSLGGSAV